MARKSVEVDLKLPGQCSCGCGLPMREDGLPEMVRDMKEVACRCGCATTFHVSAHQARIGAGNMWYAPGHIKTIASVAFTVER